MVTTMVLWMMVKMTADWIHNDGLGDGEDDNDLGTVAATCDIEICGSVACNCGRAFEESQRG